MINILRETRAASPAQPTPVAEPGPSGRPKVINIQTLETPVRLMRDGAGSNKPENVKGYTPRPRKRERKKDTLPSPTPTPASKEGVPNLDDRLPDEAPVPKPLWSKMLGQKSFRKRKKKEAATKQQLSPQQQQKQKQKRHQQQQQQQQKTPKKDNKQQPRRLRVLLVAAPIPQQPTEPPQQ